LGLYRSTDSGSTFVQLLTPGGAPFEFSQASYDLSLGVDPLDDTNVYFGLVDLFLYSATTSAVTQISAPGQTGSIPCNQWNSARFTISWGIHCDQHSVSFDSGGTLYVGTDGGVFSSPPGHHGSDWGNLNSNLGITQFYPGVAYNTANPNRVLGGTQDNGTETWNGSGWQVTAPGDGGFSAIDPVDPVNTWYASSPRLCIRKTTNGNTPWSSSTGPTWTIMATGFVPGGCAAGAAFVAPFMMDPADHLKLLAGADRPYLTRDGAMSWQDIHGTTFPLLPSGQSISATTICPDPTNAGIFYLGTSDGRAFLSTNGYSAPPTWTEVSTGLPGQWVTRITCGSSAMVYLTIGGAQTTAGTHVFVKNPGATSWASIQGDLPNTTATSLVVDSRTNPPELYASTDLGVYLSANNGTNWVPFGTGMPNVPVVDLIFDPARNMMYAATHGRGMWQASAVPPVTVYTAVSTQQYNLANSDGSTWTDMDTTSATPLRLSLTPSVNSVAILSGNSDLWTANPGYNQDIGIDVNGTIVAWKESGGFAGTFSPNAAMVQTVFPMNAGTTYTVKLRWKTNKPASGATIYAGAGPISAQYSPTRLTAELLPAGPNPYTAASTQQYTLANSDGITWTDMDATNLKVGFTPAVSGYAILSGNSDLWTANPGYNQDLAIDVNGTLAAWKESGGFAGTFSPNAAMVQTVIPVTAAVTYTAKLRWKTNKSASGATIYAGAGPIAGLFSPTRLTVQLVPAVGAATAVSNRQYTLANSDGSTWVDMDSTSATPLVLTITPAVNSTAILSGNVDLWTANPGYNQDIGIDVNGLIVSWKESGGFAGTFSPNAAMVETVFPMAAGTTYAVKLRWKANKSASGATIYAGAGPSAPFSPTSLTALLVPS